MKFMPSGISEVCTRGASVEIRMRSEKNTFSVGGASKTVWETVLRQRQVGKPCMTLSSQRRHRHAWLPARNDHCSSAGQTEMQNAKCKMQNCRAVPWCRRLLPPAIGGFHHAVISSTDVDFTRRKTDFILPAGDRLRWMRCFPHGSSPPTICFFAKTRFGTPKSVVPRHHAVIYFAINIWVQ